MTTLLKAKYGSAAALAASAAISIAYSAQALGKQTPLDVNVVNPSVPVTVQNTQASPVPVAVVAAPLQPTVTCSLDTGSSSQASPFGAHVLQLSAGLIKCPPGIDAIDLQRVIFDPDSGAFPSANVGSYRTFFGTTEGAGLFSLSRIIAVVTNGSPESVLSQSVRIDLNATNPFLIREHCTSGIVGFNVVCGGTLFLIGTPAQ